MLLAMRVLVVDHVEERGPANGEAFSQNASDAFLYDGTRWMRFGATPKEVDAPSKNFDLVLLHDNDKYIWQTLEEQGVHAKRVLRYTGGTPRNEENWIVARRITSRDSAIKVDEALELLTWLENGCPRAECDLPSLLRNRQESLLPAMAILCQGFLAVYAKEQGSVTDEIVAEALRTMGWIPEKHAGLVNEKLQTVSQCGWWLETFGLFAAGEAGKERLTPESWTPFKAEIRREWGPDQLPNCLIVLLDRFEHCEPIDSVSTVAETYLAIARMLGRGRNLERNLA